MATAWFAVPGLPAFGRRAIWPVDLVVVNTQPSSYLQALNDGIMEALFSSGNVSLTDQPGGVFVRRRDQL